MSNTIILGGAPVELDSAIGYQFVVDCVRAAEGLITDKELVEIYEISPADWQNIIKDTALARAIRAERDRRVRSGTAAREAAAQIFVRAPKIMGEILDDKQASPRHRIEASRELRATAIGGADAERPADSERFVIKIDLSAGGGDVLTFDMPKKISTEDVAPEQPKLVGSERAKLVIDNEKSDE